MSEKNEKDRIEQIFMVDGQKIQLDISSVEGRKYVSYELASDVTLPPMRVAYVLLRIAESICVDNQYDIRKLLGVPEMESNTRYH